MKKVTKIFRYPVPKLTT